MPRTKFTHEQLLAAHKRQTKALQHERENSKKWKQRAKAAELKLKQYVIVDDKPDYWFSMSGFSLFRRYYRTYGLKVSQMEVLMMISYVEPFFAIDHRIFKYSMIGVQKRIDELVAMRYITKLSFPPKGSFKRRNGHVLTQRGKDLIADYKKYYDEKMEEIRKKHVTQLTFEDGAYFKRTRPSRYMRYKAQGWGRLPFNPKFNDLYKDNDLPKDG